MNICVNPVALFCLFCPLLALGQATPSFDVTLVKENNAPLFSGTGGTEGFLQAHFHECSQHGNYAQRGRIALMAMYLAYEIEDVEGGPGWLRKQNFDIDGQREQPATLQECRLMVRELLRTRFKLAFHMISREMPVYNLVIAKSGSKLTPASGHGVKVNGSIFESGGMEAKHIGAVISAEIFKSGWRPVIDHTGLVGKFDFELNYSVRPDDGRPDAFTALEKQLGLKLEPGVETRQVMVIDHIERPDPN